MYADRTGPAGGSGNGPSSRSAAGRSVATTTADAATRSPLWPTSPRRPTVPPRRRSAAPERRPPPTGRPVAAGSPPSRRPARPPGRWRTAGTCTGRTATRSSAAAAGTRRRRTVGRTSAGPAARTRGRPTRPPSLRSGPFVSNCSGVRASTSTHSSGQREPIAARDQRRQRRGDRFRRVPGRVERPVEPAAVADQRPGLERPQVEPGEVDHASRFPGTPSAAPGTRGRGGTRRPCRSAPGRRRRPTPRRFHTGGRAASVARRRPTRPGRHRRSTWGACRTWPRWYDGRSTQSLIAHQSRGVSPRGRRQPASRARLMGGGDPH